MFGAAMPCDPALRRVAEVFHPECGVRIGEVQLEPGRMAAIAVSRAGYSAAGGGGR